MSFSFVSAGSFSNTESWLNNLARGDYLRGLDRFGQAGVDALGRATPKLTGLTSASWGYRIKGGRGGASIEWYNTNVNAGVNIAIIIQYGHGTGTGGYVRGIDYINPAIQPIYEKILDDIMKEVRA